VAQVVDAVGRRDACATRSLTFALRAGVSTFVLSRDMGASLTMIDRHYGHLARDGQQHTIALLDAPRRSGRGQWWTFGGRCPSPRLARRSAGTPLAAAISQKPSIGLEPMTPSLPWKARAFIVSPRVRGAR